MELAKCGSGVHGFRRLRSQIRCRASREPPPRPRLARSATTAYISRKGGKPKNASVSLVTSSSSHVDGSEGEVN